MKQALFIDKKGNKKYYRNNRIHREDGPAIEYINGNKFWYKHGKLHRKDGPSVELFDGTKVWFYQGNEVLVKSQEDFARAIKLLIFK